MTILNDSDACVPQTLTDFVFDLYDSVTLSQVTEEQQRLYNVLFRELSTKYFASSPWPSPQSIASECNGDPLFLALYRELTHRHWHAVSRPTVRDKLDGWDVYRELFDEILMDAEDSLGTTSSNSPKLFLLPEWCFDIVNEFVYQFQGFCQFRTALATSAVKHGILETVTPNGTNDPSLSSNNTTTTTTTTTTTNAPHHVTEQLALVAQQGIRDAWAVETVYSYLHRLIAIGTHKDCNVPVYQYLGLFASVALSRLECLVADYTACLQALEPIWGRANHSIVVVKPDQETQTARQVIDSVLGARISMAYHAGTALLMLRRTKDAVLVVGDICSYMIRGWKTGQLLRHAKGSNNAQAGISTEVINSKQYNKLFPDQYFKLHDRMIAILAICTHICPCAKQILSTSSAVGMDEPSLSKLIREKHGPPLSKDNYTDIFLSCAPKFISPAVPYFYRTTDGDNQQQQLVAHPIENAYKTQVRLLDQRELSNHSSFRKIRSYLKLYTSIPVYKLQSFFDNKQEATNTYSTENLLVSLKLMMRQVESIHLSKEGTTKTPEDEESRGGAQSSTTTTSNTTTNAVIQMETEQQSSSPSSSVLDIHYYMDLDTIHIDEAEKQRRFENYFVGQVIQNLELRSKVHEVSTEV